MEESRGEKGFQVSVFGSEEVPNGISRSGNWFDKPRDGVLSEAK